jgi:hypothetical protein
MLEHAFEEKAVAHALSIFAEGKVVTLEPRQSAR